MHYTHTHVYIYVYIFWTLMETDLFHFWNLKNWQMTTLDYIIKVLILLHVKCKAVYQLCRLVLYWDSWFSAETVTWQPTRTFSIVGRWDLLIRQFHNIFDLIENWLQLIFSLRQERYSTETCTFLYSKVIIKLQEWLV